MLFVNKKETCQFFYLFWFPRLYYVYAYITLWYARRNNYFDVDIACDHRTLTSYKTLNNRTLATSIGHLQILPRVWQWSVIIYHNATVAWTAFPCTQNGRSIQTTQSQRSNQPWCWLKRSFPMLIVVYAKKLSIKSASDHSTSKRFATGVDLKGPHRWP